MRLVVVSDIDLLEKRQNRIEDAIEKLTNISSDLNKMIAVNEQRLQQQEKQMSSLEDVMEKRREESEIKLKDVYDTIRSEDKHVIEEISKFRIESQQQHERISEKINKMEKIIWTYMGGFSVIVFLITYGPTLLKFLMK